jgi:hypothetical protein
MEERSIFKDSSMGGRGRVKWLSDSAVTKASGRERLNGRGSTATRGRAAVHKFSLDENSRIVLFGGHPGAEQRLSFGR